MVVSFTRGPIVMRTQYDTGVAYSRVTEVIHQLERRGSENTPYGPSALQAVLGCSPPFMRLAEHLAALRAWCKQCLPGW